MLQGNARGRCCKGQSLNIDCLLKALWLKSLQKLPSADTSQPCVPRAPERVRLAEDDGKELTEGCGKEQIEKV